MPEALAKAKIAGASTDIAPPWSYVAKRQALARSVLKKYAMKYGATVADPLSAFCALGHCDAARDGVPLYMDSDHITASAAKSLAYLFEPVFRVAWNI